MNKGNMLQLAKELLEGGVIIIDGISTPISEVEIPQYNIVIKRK